MHRTTPIPSRSLLVLLLAATALVSTLFTPTGVVDAAPGPGADEGLDWIAAQLDTHGGSLPASFGPGSDWGITADAVLAFVAAGRGDEPAAATATDLLVANVDEFSTWDDLGPEFAGVRLAGQLGKVVLAALAQGRDLSSVGGLDLVTELRSLMQTSGPESGRFSDRNPYSPDNSNGFGQALSMLALSFTDDGVPPTSATFLLDQQCPNGGFRLFYTGTVGCEDASTADTDGTALAIQALLAAPRTPASDAALSAAISWLLSVQDPATGAWTGSGPTATPNANSTGVIAQALRAAGEVAAADRGAEWIRAQLQLSPADAAGTPAAVDVGAIAYDPAARALALADGITSSTGDQWRRSTTQAVLAIGLERYGAANDLPLPTTTSTTTSIPATTTSTTTTAPPSTTSAPSTSLPTTTMPPSTGPAAGVDSLADSRSGPAGPAVGRLAVTGDDSGPLARGGALLVTAGVVLVATSTRRRRP